MVWDQGEPTVGRAYSERLAQLLGPPRQPKDPVLSRHEDLAASAQAMYEEAFFHLLDHVGVKTRQTRLALAGGCAMNSVANGKILGRTKFSKLYIQAAAGDAGGAIGAAFEVWHGALGQLDALVTSGEAVLPGLQRGSRRSQDDRAARELGAHHCGVAPGVAQPLLLLERGVVLFVHDDQRQARQRREHGQPGAEHDARLAARRGQPRRGARDVFQGAVQHGDARFRKRLAKPRFELRREADLGHEDDGAPAGGNGSGERLQVHLGLARPGHAVEQERVVAAGADRLLDGRSPRRPPRPCGGDLCSINRYLTPCSHINVPNGARGATTAVTPFGALATLADFHESQYHRCNGNQQSNTRDRQRAQTFSAIRPPGRP